MSIEDVLLPKRYRNRKVLFEQDLDAWRLAAQDAFALLKLNLDQLRLDAFSSGYDYNNDGEQSLSLSLEDRLNAFSGGSFPLPGTTADTFTINTDGNSLTLSSSGLSANFTVTFPSENGEVVLRTATQTLTNKTLTTPVLTTPTINDLSNVPGVPPIGSIIPFYDFNGALTFNASFWKYCDGTAGVTVGGAGAQTLPDLSNRYLVGFGTEGGGDIDTAVWATAAVGNASHQVDFSHTHTVAAHTHDLGNHTHTGPSHTHTGPSHTHGPGTLQFDAYHNGANGEMLRHDGVGGYAQLHTPNLNVNLAGGGALTVYSSNLTNQISYTDNGAGVTAADGTGNTGASGTGATSTPSTNTSGSASPATDSQLSSTQSIQPRSIRVRFIMRVQ